MRALQSLFYVAPPFGIRGAARRTSLPFFTTTRAMRHGPTPTRAQRLRSRLTRSVVVVLVAAYRAWRSLKHLKVATRPEGQGSSSPIRPPLRSPAALLRPSREQPLDAIQYELVVASFSVGPISYSSAALRTVRSGVP